MPNALRFSVLLFVLALSSSALAQDVQTSQPVPSTPLVTASVTAGRVRFAAPNAVVQLRLEVYSDAGQKLFDTELKGGSVLDWHLEDGQGEALAAGTYACLLTVKSLSGRLSQRLGLIEVGAQGASVRPAEALQLSAQQAQAVGPIEADTALVVFAADAPAAATIVAHTGTEGQLARTRGALTFRVGDFFSGTDREQMRLTEAGDLGLGTKKPQAKLDVAGDIRSTGFVRATKGIEFADGTVQTTGLSGRKDAQGNIVPNASGTGTQGRLAKWTDNAGTLGDSVAIDTGTGLQLTVPASSSVDTNVLYTISNDRTTGVIASSTPAFLAGNGPYFALRGNSYSAIANQRGLFSISTGNVTNPQGNEGSVLFLTGADQLRMSIKPNGNVGIGTANPGVKLDIQDSVSTFNGVALALTNANGGNTNPWVLGTGGRDVAKDAFSIGDSSSYKLTILANGNVGINTITPQAALDVSGDVKLGSTG